MVVDRGFLDDGPKIPATAVAILDKSLGVRRSLTVTEDILVDVEGWETTA